MRILSFNSSSRFLDNKLVTCMENVHSIISRVWLAVKEIFSALFQRSSPEQAPQASSQMSFEGVFTNRTLLEQCWTFNSLSPEEIGRMRRLSPKFNKAILGSDFLCKRLLMHQIFHASFRSIKDWESFWNLRDLCSDQTRSFKEIRLERTLAAADRNQLLWATRRIFGIKYPHHVARLIGKSDLQKAVVFAKKYDLPETIIEILIESFQEKAKEGEEIVRSNIDKALSLAVEQDPFTFNSVIDAAARTNFSAILDFFTQRWVSYPEEAQNIPERLIIAALNNPHLIDRHQLVEMVRAYTPSNAVFFMVNGLPSNLTFIGEVAPLLRPAQRFTWLKSVIEFLDSSKRFEEAHNLAESYRKCLPHRDLLECHIQKCYELDADDYADTLISKCHSLNLASILTKKLDTLLKKNNFIGILHWILNLSINEIIREFLLRILFMEWGSTDYEAAKEAIDQRFHSQNALQEMLLPHISIGNSDQDIAIAVEIMNFELNIGSDASTLSWDTFKWRESTIYLLSRKAPLKALALIEKLPPEESTYLRARTIIGIIKNLTSSNIEHAIDAVNKFFPDFDFRASMHQITCQALQSVLDPMVKEDPEHVQRLINRIRCSSLRAKLAISICAVQLSGNTFDWQSFCKGCQIPSYINVSESLFYNVIALHFKKDFLGSVQLATRLENPGRFLITYLEQASSETVITGEEYQRISKMCQNTRTIDSSEYYGSYSINLVSYTSFFSRLIQPIRHS